jgi:hypothetical protein
MNRRERRASALNAHRARCARHDTFDGRAGD